MHGSGMGNPDDATIHRVSGTGVQGSRCPGIPLS
jgi:hypothetical protein